MDAADLRAVLSDPVASRLYEAKSLMRLAYTGRDGAPRVIPIGYLWNGATFVVCTATNAAKVPALRQNPRVAVTIDTEAFPPNVLLVRGTAAVELVDGIPDEFLEIGRRTTGSGFAQWEAGVRHLYKQMARIEITPTWAKILDFETRIPSAVEELVRAADGAPG